LPAAARRLTSTGGGGVTGKPAAFGGATGRQLLLMLNINHTSEQEDKPEKFS